MKQKREKSEKLSLTPSLEHSHVREQLEGAVRSAGLEIEIPEVLVSEVSRNPRQIGHAAEALSRLANLSSEWPDELSLILSRKSIACALAGNPRGAADALASLIWGAGSNSRDAFLVLSRKEVAAAFAEDPARISRALTEVATGADLGAEDAFWLLGNKAATPLFAKNPELLSSSISRVGESAGYYSKEAFAALATTDITRAFAREPEAVAEAFIRIREATGENAGLAFSVLRKKELSAAFSKNPGAVTDAFVQMGKSSGGMADEVFGALLLNPAVSALLAKNPGEFARLAKGVGEGIAGAVSLLSVEGFAYAFAKNPKESVDAFIKLAEATGEDRKYVFAALSDFDGAFAQSPKRFAEIFSKAFGIAGRNTNRLYSLLCREAVSAFIAEDIRRAVKLADAMAYTSIVRELDSLADIKKDELSRLLGMLEHPVKLSRELGIPTLAAYKNKWGEGKKLAREAGISIEDKEVFINFAYAESTIGKKKTLALHREFGIEYFARYTKNELENLYEHAGEREDARPLLLVAYPKSDGTKVFYGRHELRGQLLEKGHYNVIFFEAETEQEFYAQARKFGEKYFGISALMIGAHGTSDSMELGPREGDERYLDFTDEKEMGQLRGLFAENPLVILDSCSTGANGKGIAAIISRLWGADLFAARQVTALKEIVLDGEGRIQGAVFFEGNIRFKNGQEIPRPEEE